MAMIHSGQIIFTGTPDEIRQSQEPRVRDFIEGNAPDDDEFASMISPSA